MLADKELGAIHQTMAEMDAAPEYSQGYKAKRLGELEQSAAALLDRWAGNVDGIISSAVSLARRGAAPKPTSPEERTYHATAALQDIESTNRDGWLKLYQDAVDKGPDVRKLELRRLLQPRLDRDEQWQHLKTSTYTDAERAYVTALKEERALRGSLEIIRLSLAAREQAHWTPVFDRIEINALNAPAMDID